MVIVSFVGNLLNLPAEEHVLLQNQVDIGNAVKPYYGTQPHEAHHAARGFTSSER
jgi:hypothetical protein